MRLLRLLVALLAALSGAALAAPAEVLISPGPGETVTDPRPVITVQLPRDGSIRPETARMWVDGREVTGFCLRTPFFVSYQPPLAMPAGPVQVRFQAGEVERSWSFGLKPVGRIRSVTFEGPEELGEYDDLTVEMRAEPGGTAWFLIEGFPKVPMQEVAEGVYRGTYQVQPGDHRLKGEVVAWLQFGPHTESMAADRPVTFFGQLFRVKILEPANGAQVPLNFEIKGRTRPRARVSVVPKIGFQEGLAAPSRNSPDGVGTIPVEADEKGFFSVTYGVPIKLPNMHVVLTVVATDAEGNRSVPSVLRVHF